MGLHGLSYRRGWSWEYAAHGHDFDDIHDNDMLEQSIGSWTEKKAWNIIPHVNRIGGLLICSPYCSIETQKANI